MFVLTVQALRAILIAIAVTVGITRQPLFIAKTKQLLSDGKLTIFQYSIFIDNVIDLCKPKCVGRRGAGGMRNIIAKKSE